MKKTPLNLTSQPTTQLTPKQFAARINKSTRTLRLWDSQGLFSPRRTPGGSPFYLEEDVENYFEGKKPKPKPPE